MIGYRPDIDGLRAVAIIPIILFHAGYEWIAGGFVGVDIFFVISGYLISSIIQDEILHHKFSFLTFYERRIRRIVPALLVVILATAYVGYFILLPDELTGLAKSSLAAIVFVPNIYFWLTSSTYFGLDIVTTPLLHTWSLGIEEQFYLVFPAFLYLLFSRFRRSTAAMVIVICLSLSFITNVLLIEIAANSKFAFYMLPARAWELLTGVVISLGILPAIRGSLIANIISLLGAAMILFSMLSLNEQSVFPGFNAVYPVLGTVLIIYSGTHRKTALSRLLAHRLLIGIGLISYSLYLWHWPVTVYVNMYWNSDYNKPLIIFASLAMACLSYHGIETRFRKRSKVTIKIAKLREIGAISVLASVICFTIITNRGIPERIPDQVLNKAPAVNNGISKQHCQQFTQNAGLDATICSLGNTNTTPGFVLWGDSHAQAIANALHLAALKTGLSGLLISSHGCRPLLGVYRYNKQRCLHFNNQVVDYINRSPGIQHVFLAGYWRIPFTGQGYDNSHFLIVDDHTMLRSPEENRRVFQRGMQRTLKALNHAVPVVIEDIPEIGSQFGKSVANHFIRRIWKNNTDFKSLEFETKNDLFPKEFNQMLAGHAGQSTLIKVYPVLCAENKCPLLLKDKLIYADGDHLSAYGASLLVPTFLDYFRKHPTTNANLAL